MKKIVVSGGFDPVHIGHLELLEDAKKLGNHLTVILNSDRFLQQKKGFIFMPFEERKKILLGFSCVDKVVRSIDKDNTVCETLKSLRKKNQVDVFANGGDRKDINDIPEYKICKDNGIEMLFDIGGDKIQSSSELIQQFNNYSEKRPWGYFENLLEEARTSLAYSTPEVKLLSYRVNILKWLRSVAPLLEADSGGKIQEVSRVLKRYETLKKDDEEPLYIPGISESSKGYDGWRIIRHVQTAEALRNKSLRLAIR